MVSNVRQLNSILNRQKAIIIIIGVPLTLLDFDEGTEIGIVEMGANHLNEIKFLCEPAQPDIGLITNFGRAHLQGFGIEGVIRGKSRCMNTFPKLEEL